MKKILSFILVLAMVLSVSSVALAVEDPCPMGGSCTHEAAIETAHYDTLVEAVKSVQADSTVTINLLCDCAGGALYTDTEKTNVNLTINFGGYTYTINSVNPFNWGIMTADATQTITLSNGTIKCDDSIVDSIGAIIVGFGSIKLDSIILDGSNLRPVSPIVLMSNDFSGDPGLEITGNTTITAASEGGIAISLDDNTKVEIDTTGTITGEVNDRNDSNDSDTGLTISSGTFVGKYYANNNPADIKDKATAADAVAQQGSNTTHIGSADRIEEIIESAPAGSSFTVLKAPEGGLEVNGETVTAGGTYIAPEPAPAPAPAKSNVPGVSYECGNTFKMETSKAPTAVLVDGVSVPFSADGKTLYVNVSGGNHWMTVEWMSTTYTFNFTCNDACQIVEVAIPKTGDMPIWAAIAAVFGF